MLSQEGGLAPALAIAGARNERAPEKYLAADFRG